MKKILLSMTAAALLFGMATPIQAVSSKQDIEVLWNARKISFPDAKPFQDDSDRVMVPIRFVSEALGAKVGWTKSGGRLSVSIKNNAHTVNMTVGQNTATIDGETKTYDTQILLKQNRTFVPLRLVSEGLGQPVEWDKLSRWVWIGSKDVPTLEESGLKPVSLDPYRKWFTDKPYLLENMEEKPYEKAIVFKQSDLPATFVRDVYSIELYTDPKTTNTYLKVRAKTTSGAGNLYYLTKKKDIRYRNPMDSMTVNNGDGTKYCFYQIRSSADKILHGIVDQKNLTIQDIEYIGFDGASTDYIPLMTNPWKGN
ncbi:copper amine oxidase N-terminal domain-containing protein [Paenibacillus sp. P96]|uniref:Copper amine oxidase N-terminal domain-containing protein n=1 Tax=Paenibacillus zeirhizosphaerae TaxID=2987519 RepID=A0ABT9FQQ8_9BACL|nr:copper amine oxidase N-terminal domain-containing protein [Paenibacillus sp. P96]MDP4097066.1 copper amine oxidase N-terminal domain-containing protein [Paenibacillus sp. P96]